MSDVLIEADGALENRKGEAAIGTTKRGIGPTYAAKALRLGLRVGDLLEGPRVLKNKYNELVKNINLLYDL